ncbi:hypothetical protein VP01_26g5 [Puccinia sorghi]|uniref:Uncharacterized protein n=1 Tax=Puccinia sorghi TaxID=27349 RepID=A0A0L6V3M6_9BASI|nr:hypothetical protein VP01_26g5 [Puccinia sorghi]
MKINVLNEELEMRFFCYSTSFKILTIYAAFQSSDGNDGGGWSYQSFCPSKLIQNNFRLERKVWRRGAGHGDSSSSYFMIEMLYPFLACKGKQCKRSVGAPLQELGQYLEEKRKSLQALAEKKPTNVNPENYFELFDAPETNDKTKGLKLHRKQLDNPPGPCENDSQSPF